MEQDKKGEDNEQDDKKNPKTKTRADQLTVA